MIGEPERTTLQLLVRPGDAINLTQSEPTQPGNTTTTTMINHFARQLIDALSKRYIWKTKINLCFVKRVHADAVSPDHQEKTCSLCGHERVLSL